MPLTLPKSGLTAWHVFAKIALICDGVSPLSALSLNRTRSRRRTFIQLLSWGVGCPPNFRRHLRHDRECCSDSSLRVRSHLSKRSALSTHNGDDRSCYAENRVAAGRNAERFHQPLVRHERVLLPAIISIESLGEAPQWTMHVPIL